MKQSLCGHSCGITSGSLAGLRRACPNGTPVIIALHRFCLTTVNPSRLSRKYRTATFRQSARESTRLGRRIAKCQTQKREYDPVDENVPELALETPQKNAVGKEGAGEKPGKPNKEPANPVLRYFVRVLRLLVRISKQTINKQGARFFAGCAFLLVSTLMVLAATAGPGSRTKRFQPPREVVYSEFLTLLDTGNVRAVRFDDGSQRIYFDTQRSQVAADATETASTSSSVPPPNRQSRSAPPREYYTKRISDPSLISKLTDAGVEFGAMQTTLSSVLARVVGTMLMVWLPVWPMYYIMRKVVDSRMGSRKKSGSVRGGSGPVVTFADVAGLDSAKEELMEVVACLRDARRYAKLNARMPSGVLLCGPPGTGKTLLAKAVAGEAGVPFFAASASEFVEMFVGRGAARIRDLFKESRKNSPCVVFIDELDAIGGRRGISMNEERDQTLNQLLTELDGFEERTGVLLLAATNRPQVLDPALTRPGRLSRKVLIPLPDERGRMDILSVHLRRVPMESAAMKELAAENIARVTSGFSGAELANVVNEAALMAGRKGLDTITMRELVEGVQRTKFGVNGGGVLMPARGLSRRLMDWAVDMMASNRAQIKTAQTMG